MSTYWQVSGMERFIWVLLLILLIESGSTRTGWSKVLQRNMGSKSSFTTKSIKILKMLSKGKSEEKGDKCSIVFSTAHKSGALFGVLKVFSDADINLTRIESRPIAKDPGKFGFLLDFQGSDEDGKIADAIEKVKKETTMFKFLGCYKEAKE